MLYGEGVVVQMKTGQVSKKTETRNEKLLIEEPVTSSITISEGTRVIFSLAIDYTSHLSQY